MSMITVEGYSRVAGLYKIAGGDGYGVWYKDGWAEWQRDWRRAAEGVREYGGCNDINGELLIPEEML